MPVNFSKPLEWQRPRGIRQCRGAIVRDCLIGITQSLAKLSPEFFAFAKQRALRADFLSGVLERVLSLLQFPAVEIEPGHRQFESSWFRILHCRELTHRLI